MRDLTEIFPDLNDDPPTPPGVRDITADMNMGDDLIPTAPEKFKEEGQWEGWIKPSLKEVAEGVKATPEAAYSLLSGVATWPVTKAFGVGQLVAGGTAEEAREIEAQAGEYFGYHPSREQAVGATEVVGKGIEAALTPARMAGEGMASLVGPRAGYLTELAAELFMFKMGHGLTKAGKSVLQNRAIAKSAFNKRMSELNSEQRKVVSDMAKTMEEPRDITQTAKDPFEEAYETQKDIWIGNKDVRFKEVELESSFLKKSIRLGKEYDPFDPESGKGPKISHTQAMDYDAAIQLYIDSPVDRIPADVFERLSKEQQRIITLANHLPPEVKEVADRIRKSYEDAGIDALDADVIKNIRDNYARRAWAEGKGKRKDGKKFGTTTPHAKMRKYETIIDGWLDGKELETKGASENLRKYKEEVLRAIEDKRFMKELRKLKDVEGNPLLSTQQWEGYVRVEHPNFKAWEWAGDVKRGIAVTPEFVNKIKTLGDKLKKLRVETEKETTTKTTKTTTEQSGETGELAEGGPMAKLENVVREALRSRGMTESEADVYIRKLKSKGSDAIKEIFKEKTEKTETVKTKLKSDEIESGLELPELTTIEIGKTYGKNFFTTEDGILFERRELYAPKKQAKNLNDIMGISKLEGVPGIKGFTKFNEVTKSWILQSSLYHHQAFMRSYYLPGLSPKELGELGLRQAYKEGIRSIEQQKPSVMLGVRNGLTLGLKQDWVESIAREGTWIGKIVDKVGGKGVKEKINSLRDRHVDFLFGEFGAGLKAKAFEIEFREQIKKYPDQPQNIVAARVAHLINDDFGGLHLQRLGRNPTLQHIFRLALLAPDWTESNIRTMAKTLRTASGDASEIQMYRKFWGGVVVKGMGLTAIANYLLAGGDMETLKKNYERAWAEGNLRWTEIDITPIYKALGGETENRKYFTIFGHFRDPAKFITHPVRSLKHKGSVAAGIGLEALTGSDWAGRGFTTLSELVETGETVKWGQGKEVNYEHLPSFALSQIVGTQPIQLQNFIGWMNGELEGFDAVSRGMGFMTSTTYQKKHKGFSNLSSLEGLEGL